MWGGARAVEIARAECGAKPKSGDIGKGHLAISEKCGPFYVNT